MINHPFKSLVENEFRIIDVKACTKKFLFHSSGKKIGILDPEYNSRHGAYGNVHEYGIPVVFASDNPSNAFCYEPTDLYKETRKKVGTSVYHRLTHEKHKILLGAVLKGYIYVLNGSDFYEVTREDFETGKWIRSTEWISKNKVTPIDSIEITKPYDWEMLPEYEFLGTEHVGQMDAGEYLLLAKDEEVKNAIKNLISSPFIPVIPKGLEKYL